MQQEKEKSRLSELFSAKKIFCDSKIFPPRWFGSKDSFFSLKLRLKSQILSIFGVFGLLCITL